MEEKIKELRAAIEEAAAAVTDQAQLSDFWQKFLSKHGAVAGLTKSLRDVPKEDRPAVGKTINEFKQWAEGQYQALSVQVEQAALAARNAAETVDITMPPKVRLNGSLCRNLTPKGAFWYETSDRWSGQYGQAPRTPVQRH